MLIFNRCWMNSLGVEHCIHTCPAKRARGSVVERSVHIRKVDGSNPSGLTKGDGRLVAGIEDPNPLSSTMKKP